jgi:hypothetical protein
VNGMSTWKIAGIIGIIITIIVMILEAIKMIKQFFFWIIAGLVIATLLGLAIGYIRKKLRDDEDP